MDDREWITHKAAANLLDLPDTRAVLKLISAGRLTTRGIPGVTRLRVLRSEVAEIAKHLVTPARA